MFAHVARDRAGLADILGPARRKRMDAREYADVPVAGGAEAVVAVWSRDPRETGELPELVVVADGTERDCTAWVATFAPGLRPFSAHFRIAARSEFLSEERTWRAPSAFGLDHALAGLVLTDVFLSHVLTGVQVPPDFQTTLGCTSTLSFALMRDVLLHRGERDPHRIIERWIRARQLTKQRDRQMNPADTWRVVRVLQLLADGDVPARPDDATMGIANACAELRNSGEIRSAWRFLGGDFAQLIPGLSGPREARLGEFERLLSSLKHRGRRLEIGESFAAAYVASTVGPGSLAQIALAAQLLPVAPEALLWFGVCAGLHPESNVAGELGGVGRRALRDLCMLEPLVGRPRVDISLLELEVYAAGDRTGDGFPTGSPSHLQIELSPCISTVVNWSERYQRGAQVAEAQPRPAMSADHSRLLSDLGMTLERAQRLLGLLAEESGNRQGELFDSSKSKRRKK